MNTIVTLYNDAAGLALNSVGVATLVRTAYRKIRGAMSKRRH